MRYVQIGDVNSESVSSYLVVVCVLWSRLRIFALTHGIIAVNVSFRVKVLCAFQNRM